jgi:hypothetical protein
MPDDLDDLDAVLRRTMASLDRQTPEGYFDALPARTLARLDDAAPGEPHEAPGLEDVRELASETRARLSAQRGAQGAPGSAPHADLDDQVAASSAVWKAVALPAGSANDAAARASAETSPPTPQPAATSLPATSQPAAASQAAALPQPATSRPASRGGRRAVWVAITGGLAAAGAVGYLAVARRDAGDATLVAESPTRVASVPSGAAAPARSAASPTVAASVPAVPGDAGMADGRLAIELPRPGPSRDANPGSSPRAHESAGKSVGSAKKEPRPVAKRADAARAPAKGVVDPFDSGKPIDNLKPGDPMRSGGAAAGSGSAQVPLDQLLGESGSAKPAPVKAKLARTSLSSDDIKRGMAAVERKAHACFAGTQGLAPVRLTVAPSGRVTKATVTGMFAGSPAGACVERAVRAARFAPWDGGPQSFNYNYLLSD